MELKKHNVEIDSDDPFANDWLERKSFATQLTNVIENNKQGEVVIGLSGQWGEGKTTFVKMWQKYMDKREIASIYFDAFEYDYLEDVFLSLAIEIYKYAEKRCLTTKEDYLNKSKNTYHLLRTMMAKTSPINLDANLQEDIAGNENQTFDISKIIKDSLNFASNDAFEQALKQKEVFNDFKKSLSQIASQASDQELPLVIIIDELDRCKPSFAVEILEKIKHLFLVKDVIFVLSMHHEQLEESIKKIYGQNIDAHTYLQKFVDYPTRLPKADLSSSSNRRKYFWNQVDFIGLPAHPSQSMHRSYELFLILSMRYNISYRQMNKALQNYKYLIASLNSDSDNSYPTMFLMVFISMLKVKNGILITRIRNNNATYQELVENISGVKGQNEFNLEVLRNLIRFSFLTIDDFKETEYNSQERNFYDNFNGLIGKDENKALINLVQCLESFENY